MAYDPGLDLHEWETEYQALEPQLEDDPAGALPDLADLLERILVARGVDVNDPVAREGDDPELVAEYLAAREIATLAERGEASPGDLGQAIAGLRALYEQLIGERRIP